MNPTPEQVGRQLRQARQHLGMTLEDVHSATGIPLAYLDALERGRLETLPSPGYARGYVRSYAATVRLDGDALALALSRWVADQRRPAKAAAGVAGQGWTGWEPAEDMGSRPIGIGPARIRRSRPSREARRTLFAPPSRRLRLSRLVTWPARIVGAGLVVLLLAAAIQAVAGGGGNGSTAKRAAPRPVTTTTAPMPRPTTPYVPSATTADQATYAVAAPQFTLSAQATSGPCWLFARRGPNGDTLYAGTLQPGESKTITAAEDLWVRLGNGNNVSLALDGVPVNLPPQRGLPYNIEFQHRP